MDNKQDMASQAHPAPGPNPTVHELAVFSTLPPATAPLPAPPPELAGTPASPPDILQMESASAPKRSRSRHITVIIALLASLFIPSLMQTILNNAIPTITRELHSAGGYAWIGAAYMLANAVSCPVWAKLSDIWGRKPILLWAVACFAASTVVCALSRSITMLVVGRALQGVAAGGLTQLVSIIISDLFSMRRRSLYIGLLEVVWAVAGGVGPVLGGVLSERVSWRWVFWVVLPPCAIAFVLLLLALDVHNPRTGLRRGLEAVDWAGTVTMLGFLVMLLLGLNFGGVDFSWSSATVVCLLVFGAVMGLVFVFCEKRIARYPLMPLKIFTTKSNLAVLFIGFAHDFTLVSVEYYMPFYFQSAKAASPITSGVLILPYAMTPCVVGFLTGFYIDKTGRYMEFFWVGQGLMVIGMALFSQFSAETTIPQLCGMQIIPGLGMGMLFAAPLVSLQASVPQSQTATATATMTLVRNISTVLAVVSGQAIFQNGMEKRQGQLEAAGLSMSLRMAFSGSQAAANTELVSKISDLAQRAVVKDVFAKSLADIWILNACLVGVGFLVSAFVEKKPLSKDHVETKTGIVSETN